jgi:superfamily II DNA or RNA helicase
MIGIFLRFLDIIPPAVLENCQDFLKTVRKERSASILPFSESGPLNEYRLSIFRQKSERQSMNHEHLLAPGARVLIRDAEWLVRRVDRTSTSGKALTCIGLSELVKDKEAVFLTEIEKLRNPVQILDPAQTELVPDRSAEYEDALLYMESLLRQTPPTDANLYIGHKGAMDLVPYQLDPAIQALQQPRQRILIADAVGLGKTLEAGILMSELIRRGRGKRILVVAIKSLLTQFQKEMWTRFAIALTRLDSIGLQRVRSRIPTNHNPFYYFDKSIISIDTLKQDNEFKIHLEKSYWDIIVIDEAHNVAERGHGSTQRARLAKLLSSRSDTLIMLSATPHDGRARSFASLMNMLDPTAIADPENYGPEDIQGLFIRRFKKDIHHQVTESFQEREIAKSYVSPADKEEEAYSLLTDLHFTRLDRARKAGHLFATVLEKALFSSPAACLETLAHRLEKLYKEENPEFAADIAALESLKERVAAITPKDFAKFGKLVGLLKDKKSPIHWTGADKTDRLVIFTERIATLDFLYAHLPKALGLGKNAVTTLHGGMSDIEQQEIVEDFGREESGIRLLIASDVASEGINLHYLCHRLIHFDIPWSLMVFQQRNGRIDRYGQKRTPLITYLVNESSNPKIRGDMRILELLIQKDEEAVKNIGDPSALMGVYDIDAEIELTAAAMESEKSAADFEAQDLSAGTGTGYNVLEFMMQRSAETKREEESTRAVRSMPSLFADDFAYAAKALHRLRHELQLDLDMEPERRMIRFSMPEDLKHRFRYLPREIRPRDGNILLTDDTTVMQAEIERCRKDEEAWPKLHYLWPLHPAIFWLNDKVLANFRRHEAPVLSLPTLAHEETVYILTGIIPNQKGQPLIQRWIGAAVKNGDYEAIEPFENLLHRTGLARQRFSNPGIDHVDPQVQSLLPEIIERAQNWMGQKRNAFEEEMNRKLDEHLNQLEALRMRHLDTLQQQVRSMDVAEKAKERRAEEKKRQIQALFDQYMDWIQETMTTEKQAYIKLVAVLQGMRDAS